MVANSLSSNGRLDGGKEEKRNPPKAAATAVDEEASYIRIHRCHLKDPRLGFANLETERANGEVEVECILNLEEIRCSGSLDRAKPDPGRAWSAGKPNGRNSRGVEI
jgi:hypothetical protein